MTKQTEDILKIIGVVLLSILIVVLLGIGPILTIISINTLFMTQIPITIWTWLAMLWLKLTTVGAVIGLLKQIRNKL
jgi:Na+/proline symporter